MLIGQSVSHYQILKRLGSGGMGEVYLAEDQRLGRKVALKLLPQDFTADKERLIRFENEARAASALNHPNILTIYEIGKLDDSHFLATEYIDGQTLRQQIQTGPLNLSNALDIAMQVAGALAAAHAANIIHRDIKPENIMLRPDGYVKVLDFGLAKFIDPPQLLPNPEAPTIHRTSQGIILGTPHYMSPEQVRGVNIGPQTDIFSLGVVLYEMVAQRLPFTGETLSDLIVAILDREPTELPELDEEYDYDFRQLLNKALSKDQAARHKTANELLMELKTLKQEIDFDVELQRSLTSGRHRRTSLNIQRSTLGELPPIPAAQPLIEQSLKPDTGQTTVAAHSTADQPTTSTDHPAVETAARHASTLTEDAGPTVSPTVSPTVNKEPGPEREQPSINSAQSLSSATTPATSSMEATETATLVKESAAPVKEAAVPAAKSTAPAAESTSPMAESATLSVTKSVDSQSPAPKIKQTTIPGPKVQDRFPASVPTQLPSRPQQLRLNLFMKITSLAFGLVFMSLIFWFSFRYYTQPVKNNETPNINSRQITTWSGLDIFPNFSPDGRSIAYSSDRSGKFEIYIKQLTTGGREIQLTENGEQNFEPAWSPNGEMIAYYCKNRSGIWLVPALGGTPKQLTEFGSRPAWSPDGQSLVFQSEPLTDIGVTAVAALAPSTIWTVSAQGGAPRQLTILGQPLGGHGEPNWSPDGQRVVFTTSEAHTSEIWSISIKGNEPIKLAANGRYCFNPIYAPDGNHLYYSNWDSANNGIYKLSLNPETGRPNGDAERIANLGLGRIKYLTISRDGQRLAYSLVSLSSNLWTVPLEAGAVGTNGTIKALTRETDRSFFPTFSADGKLAFNRSNSGASTNIWLLDADGNPVQVTSETGGANIPNWLPNGEQIVYQSNQDNHATLWAWQINTGKKTRLVEFSQDMTSPRLSPDGRMLSFNSKKNGGISNLWLANIDGSDIRQLTNDREMISFSCWSPDGRYLAAAMKRGDDQQVALISIADGQVTQLTSERGLSWPHSWSPDGDKITFAGLRNGAWNIWWISRSTKEQHQLTDYTKFNSYVRYPAWSPKGDQIVYEYAEVTGNIWLIDKLK